MTKKRPEHHKRRSQHPGVKDFRGKKFVLASQINVKRLEPYIERILEALGAPESLVTDEALIWDFTPWLFSKEKKLLWLAELDLANTLGVEVGLDEYLYTVAERMRARDG